MKQDPRFDQFLSALKKAKEFRMTQETKRPFVIFIDQRFHTIAASIDEAVKRGKFAVESSFVDLDLMRFRIYDIDNQKWTEISYLDKSNEPVLLSEVLDEVIEEMKHAQDLDQNKDI